LALLTVAGWYYNKKHNTRNNYPGLKEIPTPEQIKLMKDAKMELVEINIFPIKSCKGFSVKSWPIDKYGLENDRRWVIVDSTNNLFLTQRQEPKLALVAPTFVDGFLQLDAPGMPTLKIPLGNDQRHDPQVKVTVWGDDMTGVDEGNEVASWISIYLNKPNFRLVRMKQDHDRLVPTQYRDESAENYVAFADAFPFLLISEESLADLNKRIGSEQLPMNRFRPNFVVRGAPYAFAEDQFGRFNLGKTTFLAAKKCTRCKLTTVDQTKGEFKNEEPLKTLHKYREGLLQGKQEVCFGQNLIHENYDTIVSVGQTVQIL